VITCLPDIWNAEEELDDVLEDEPPNVIERINRRVRDNYWRIRTPLDLATIIVESCTANATEQIGEMEKELEDFHYLDWFYLSIREVVSTTNHIQRTFNAHESRWWLKLSSLSSSLLIPREWRRWPSKWTSPNRTLRNTRCGKWNLKDSSVVYQEDVRGLFQFSLTSTSEFVLLARTFLATERRILIRTNSV
jgi:hypothetical protein